MPTLAAILAFANAHAGDSVTAITAFLGAYLGQHISKKTFMKMMKPLETRVSRVERRVGLTNGKEF